MIFLRQISLVILFLGAGLSAVDFSHADALNQAGFPDAAIGELLHYRAHVATERADSLAASLRLLQICFQQAKYEQARSYLRYAQEIDDDQPRSAALNSYTQIKARNYFVARTAAFQDDPNTRTARAISELYLGDFAAAQASIAQSRHPELETWRVFLASQRQKQPYLAASLALIPGLGYAYNGMYETALSALLINAAFMATVWELQQHDLRLAAIAVGLAGSSFYLGNIWGSANAANQLNLARRERMLDQNLDHYIQELLAIPEP